MITAEISNSEIVLTRPYSIKGRIEVCLLGRYEGFEDTAIGILDSSNSKILVFSQSLGTQITCISGLFCMSTSEFDHIPIWDSKSSSDTKTLHNKSKFQRLVDEWKNEHPRGVDVSVMVTHPSYQQIIGMGDDAVPLLLQELEREPDHWFYALWAITGADPVPLEYRGNIREMAKAWVNWGKQQNHRW